MTFNRTETLSIYQDDIVRVDFQMPTMPGIFDPSKHTNTLFHTGIGMELQLKVGEPSLWRVYKTTILGVVIGVYGLVYIYSHIKKVS